MDSLKQNNSEIIQNKSLSTVKEEGEDEKFFLTCDSGLAFKKKSNGELRDIKEDQNDDYLIENLNETIRDLRRENLIYKEQMKSLRKEIQEKEIHLKEYQTQTKTLKNLIKFRPNWSNNFEESIRLVEHVLDYCSENNYFYTDSSQSERKEASQMVPQINLLLQNLQDGFKCLREINNSAKDKRSYEGSLDNSHMELLSSMKKLKRVQTENDLSISNEFKLDLGFIKEDFLRKNYTFDIPTTSDDGSAVSRKMKSKRSSKEDNKKMVYICSIEQQLSSEEKSYKLDKNQIDNITKGFLIVEKRDHPEEIKKKKLYNNLFIKDTKPKSFKTIESKEIDEITEREDKKKQTGGFDIELDNPYDEVQTEKNKIGGSRDLIYSVSKESMKEELISNHKQVPNNRNKILDNFSFNFNENKSFKRIREQNQTSQASIKQDDIPVKIKDLQRNLFKNNCDSIRSIETEENISFVQSKPQNEITNETNLVTSEVIQKSSDFKIESNYFNIRPMGGYLKNQKKLVKNRKNY